MKLTANMTVFCILFLHMGVAFATQPVTPPNAHYYYQKQLKLTQQQLNVCVFFASGSLIPSLNVLSSS